MIIFKMPFFTFLMSLLEYTFLNSAFIKMLWSKSIEFMHCLMETKEIKVSLEQDRKKEVSKFIYVLPYCQYQWFCFSIEMFLFQNVDVRNIYGQISFQRHDRRTYADLGSVERPCTQSRSHRLPAYV